MLLVLLGAVGMVLPDWPAPMARQSMCWRGQRRRQREGRGAGWRWALRAGVCIRQMAHGKSLLISLIGGGLGGLLAIEGVRALVSLLPAGFPRAAEIHVNAPVVWLHAV